MASGIYKIINLINGKFYIGSSKNIDERWRIHKVYLIRNKHHSRHLQSSWNKYGADAFEFHIIEYCEKEKLIEREQYYLDTLKPIYNSSPTARSPLGTKHTKEFKLKARNRQLGIRYVEVHRNFEKWPCKDGIKCKCSKCKKKKNEYMINWRRSKSKNLELT
ncbi:MAG TPA: GIY-YIG nuclease family protein [Gammaproteobacteria bacterium]|nr:GIY-YIG nuclease family protein [Gammaproteobacteria bacterium]